MVLTCCLPWMKGLAVIAGCGVFVACSKDIPRPPIVTDQAEPWEERYAQEKHERELAAHLEGPHVVAGQGYGYDQKTEEDKHSGIVTTLADIVAFPLRGAAWLAHTLL